MYQTLTQTVKSHGALRWTALVLLGTLTLTLAAKIQIPFWPVPMTLHTLALMGLAVALGGRATVAIMLGYLAAGAAGLPVFSGSPERGIGLAYMVGPTGGYLLGYLVAALLVGHLAAGRKALGRFGAMLLGMLPIYGFGAAWLAMYVPTAKVWSAGVAPFLLGDFVKILLVTAASLAADRAIRRWKGVGL